MDLYKNRLTVNQIMLLLDIYRGTHTQREIGTYIEDLKVLNKMGFITGTKNSSANWEMTEEGRELVIDTIQFFLDTLND